MEANKEKYGTARDMSVPEKEVSFLNGYFMFRKARQVDEGDVAKDYSRGGNSASRRISKYPSASRAGAEISDCPPRYRGMG